MFRAVASGACGRVALLILPVQHVPQYTCSTEILGSNPPSFQNAVTKDGLLHISSLSLRKKKLKLILVFSSSNVNSAWKGRNVRILDVDDGRAERKATTAGTSASKLEGTLGENGA